MLLVGVAARTNFTRVHYTLRIHVLTHALTHTHTQKLTHIHTDAFTPLAICVIVLYMKHHQLSVPCVQ